MNEPRRFRAAALFFQELGILEQSSYFGWKPKDRIDAEIFSNNRERNTRWRRAGNCMGPGRVYANSDANAFAATAVRNRYIEPADAHEPVHV
ncbi:MAG TPA: hypothetical protein PKE16_09390 [Hyphomicrobium sp.]|nr:hypothetical protein [Hyphomicrobium sp.]